MTAQRYVRNVLQLSVLPLMQRLPEAISQQVNARPHTAKVSQDCLLTVTIILWPALSPDLPPMEHIKDHLGWQVGHPTSLSKQEARKIVFDSQRSPVELSYPHRPNGNVVLSEVEKSVEGFRETNPNWTANVPLIFNEIV
ncbi:transposable element Tcb2 transposase [Trichonephila clavipes]|nr:transposable element Tcb2 transposase [Trichonephila clavipes]